MNKLPEKKKVLLIVAHSDDETFGCGGTVRRHIEEGDKVFAIAFTNGVSSRTNSARNDSAAKERLQNAHAAAKVLGFTWHSIENWPDNGLDQVPLLELVKFVEEVKAEIQPQIIYTHSKVDLNVDHRRVHEAVLTAFRPQPSEKWEEIRAFEVPSATDWGMSVFSPQLTVEITHQWNEKMRAMQCYANEMREYPHSRSLEAIKALAMTRGAQSGFKKAEAFEIIRKRMADAR
ncbi:GlcNAc-PI de-N-acetylase family protein [Pseudogulbenkiania sp. NH8B]|uniref:PIG-L deacetylase family protein n=1 Tax=Pseudogulbenkiania sp. (strain NH8B) TaxID=748280 RepID=UPI000227A5A0|nr:PIG-L deacetylase family protein [Pseudogulbenkiania sp. NH8B]BAK78299.1 GlcNAc-PI de-N-acetylase family protein [Pseudogulbenkiania sp. NH8B]